jgi:hypothetical protein
MNDIVGLKNNPRMGVAVVRGGIVYASETGLPADCAPARATVISELALEGLVAEVAVVAAIA